VKTIDFRSDTVSHPTPAMREAMACAEVGDDVYGDDPTVNQLEAEAAELLGKEAALFVSSGTQGNLIALLTHCARGDEAILGDKAHTFVYEAGGLAALGGIIPHTVPVQPDGTMALDDIRRAIRGNNVHFPRSALVSIENTQGTVGGMPLSLAYTESVAAIAREHGLKFHIDGARIFNAAAYFGISARDLIAPADSMTFCLSKGLCAPVGSILVGSRTFIEQARRARKQLGGGLRQAGILAAAGLIAIREMVHRIPEDHVNARLLADQLQTVPHLRVDMTRVKTNFVFFDLLESAPLTPEQLVARLQDDYGILMRPYPGFRATFRAVTHYWITPERIYATAAALRALLS
jgi:threonine aldolase